MSNKMQKKKTNEHAIHSCNMQVAMIMLKSHMETSVRIIVETVVMGHQFPLMFHSSAPEQL